MAGHMSLVWSALFCKLGESDDIRVFFAEKLMPFGQSQIQQTFLLVFTFTSVDRQSFLPGLVILAENTSQFF